MTKRRDLIKELESAGFRLYRSGGNHDIYVKGSLTVPVERHREIYDRMADKIRKEAGLK